jgi:hypothetical protein
MTLNTSKSPYLYEQVGSYTLIPWNFLGVGGILHLLINIKPILSLKSNHNIFILYICVCENIGFFINHWLIYFCYKMKYIIYA